VNVSVHRHEPSVTERCDESIELSREFQANLGPEPFGGRAVSGQTQCTEAAVESPVSTDQQVYLRRRGQRHTLEQIDVEHDTEMRALLQRRDGVVPARSIDNDAHALNRPTVVTGDDPVGYSGSEPTVVSVNDGP
jgi:hypothetical protein